MATTTNFDWETPDDTDLVKDGAAAMRTLGIFDRYIDGGSSRWYDWSSTGKEFRHRHGFRLVS
jgi:hypothetical protein